MIDVVELRKDLEVIGEQATGSKLKDKVNSMIEFNNMFQALTELERLQKKEVAMKPLRYDYGGYQCPNCKGLYVQARESDNSEVNLNHCNDCGQYLDWSDEK
jgi:predicted SprT family Zn-dependent metalloprotease